MVPLFSCILVKTVSLFHVYTLLFDNNAYYVILMMFLLVSKIAIQHIIVLPRTGCPIGQRLGNQRPSREQAPPVRRGIAKAQIPGDETGSETGIRRGDRSRRRNVGRTVFGGGS